MKKILLSFLILILISSPCFSDLVLHDNNGNYVGHLLEINHQLSSTLLYNVKDQVYFSIDRNGKFAITGPEQLASRIIYFTQSNCTGEAFIEPRLALSTAFCKSCLKDATGNFIEGEYKTQCGVGEQTSRSYLVLGEKDGCSPCLNFTRQIKGNICKVVETDFDWYPVSVPTTLFPDSSINESLPKILEAEKLILSK
jgi:hypothetical protein